MDTFKRIFLSKKVIVSLIGLIVAIATVAGIDISPVTQALLLKIVATIVASFNVGQGLADGLSKGRTSATRDF